MLIRATDDNGVGSIWITSSHSCFDLYYLVTYKLALSIKIKIEMIEFS